MTDQPRCPTCGHAEHFQPCRVELITHNTRGIRFDPCDCPGEWAAREEAS